MIKLYLSLQFFEVGATSALLHALGPLRYETNNPKPTDKQRLTHVYSESETDSSWSSSQGSSSMGRKAPANGVKKAHLKRTSKGRPKRLRRITSSVREAKRKERKSLKQAAKQNGSAKSPPLPPPLVVISSTLPRHATIVNSNSLTRNGGAAHSKSLPRHAGSTHTSPGATSNQSNNSPAPSSPNDTYLLPTTNGVYTNGGFRHETDTDRPTTPNTTFRSEAEEATTPL